MGKKRKSIASRLDEVDRTMYSTFSSAASSLSHLYTQAMNQQKISFQEGERHGLEKVHQWILRNYEEGSSLSPADIVAYLQNEIDNCGEDTPTSPRMQPVNHHNPPSRQFANLSSQTAALMLGQATGGHAPRSGHSDQAKNTVFSNVLASPIRRSLQHCQLAQNGGYCPNNNPPSGNGTRNMGAVSPNVNRDTSSTCSNDMAMDMH